MAAPPNRRTAVRASRRTSAPAPPEPARRRRTSEGSVGDRFFREMVQSMRNGVLAISRRGEVVLVNDEAYRMLDLPHRAGDVGRHFSEVLKDHPDLVRIMAGAFEMSHLPNRAELRLKPSGLVIGYTLCRVTSEHGRANGAALFFKDLTLVEQAEERERLRDRLAAVGEMAAAIAHEVKNPLASIEVMAGLLRRQLSDRADFHAPLLDIINEAKMANAIVLEVLEFVRPIRLEMDRTSIARVVSEAVSMAESQAVRGHTAVGVTIPPSLPLMLADHHQLRQVVSNLLINAFEALEGRGSVHVSATHVESQDPARSSSIVIEVSDDGPGITSGITDRIFKPFFTTKPKGSGLGLAIVRKIVDAHEGRIDITSAAGHGATFRVTLPVVTPGSLPL
jgi:signal transduction histidine kinase